MPILEFADGSTLTEPTLRKLGEKLANLDLQARPPTWSERLTLLLESPILLVMTIGVALVGIIGRQPWLIILGVAILVLSLVASWWGKRKP